jgi:hypothetical protein
MKSRLLTSVLLMGTLVSFQAMAQSSISREDVQLTAKCGLGLRTYDATAGKAEYADLTPAFIHEMNLTIPKASGPGPHIDMDPVPATQFKFQVNSPDGLLKVDASINADEMVISEGEAQYLSTMSVTIVKDDLVVQNPIEQTRIAYGNPLSFLNPVLRTKGVWLTKNFNASKGSPRQYFANCEYTLKKKTAAVAP